MPHWCKTRSGQPFHHTLIAGTTCSNLFLLLHLEAEVGGEPRLFCVALV
jgi:hypothetical protein